MVRVKSKLKAPKPCTPSPKLLRPGVWPSFFFAGPPCLQRSYVEDHRRARHIAIGLEVFWGEKGEFQAS